MAKENADEIEKFLREKYLNQRITKSSLRTIFRLPCTRSITVWEILKQRGANIEHYTIMIEK